MMEKKIVNLRNDLLPVERPYEICSVFAVFVARLGKIF